METTETRIPKKEEQESKETIQIPYFDFSQYTIEKGSLGPIKIGMTIQQAEEKFSALVRQEALATDFGFGGGSPAYIYNLNKKPVFALIPTLGTDTILVISAIHENLQTSTGISPGVTAGELLNFYPDLIMYQDLMNGWEYTKDTVNQWTFVFVTDEKNQVGEYPVLENPSKPRRLDIKSNWITIQ